MLKDFASNLAKLQMTSFSVVPKYLAEYVLMFLQGISFKIFFMIKPRLHVFLINNLDSFKRNGANYEPGFQKL